MHQGIDHTVNSQVKTPLIFIPLFKQNKSYTKSANCILVYTIFFKQRQ